MTNKKFFFLSRLARILTLVIYRRARKVNMLSHLGQKIIIIRNLGWLHHNFYECSFWSELLLHNNTFSNRRTLTLCAGSAVSRGTRKRKLLHLQRVVVRRKTAVSGAKEPKSQKNSFKIERTNISLDGECQTRGCLRSYLL